MLKQTPSSKTKTMKHNFFTTGIMLAFLGISTSIFAQSSDESNKNAEAITVAVGGSFAKPKIMPRLEKFGLAQITVKYKLTTTERTVGKDKSSGKVAGAKLTAYLETTDGELTNADFQEITDHFYSYFQKKLKENGIDTVAWNTITGTDFYKNADDKVVSNDEEKGNGQVWVTFNAHNGNILHQGNIAFAFGKIKKAARFADEIGAPAGFFQVTVDFADIMVNVDIKSSESGYPSGFYPYTRTTTFKYSAATKPNMRVVPSPQSNTLLWNEKSQGESIVVNNDIESNAIFHTAVNQDPSRIKNKAFAFAKSMDPVIIETTREKYKAAAEKALEKYADAFIAKAKQLKKD